ncbi:hypothetical protein OOT46_27565 [Aquabacterium sp. A7-Y]|uniref:hypothetical protein n=1 Tax=Aquabacterium sp. A7-Y TaxID=1349605 RepID=UPI00223D83A5|nr:hypothetical protein [Aquabacterium sp. A7-Y]MCW7541568.1 hypothetical protein [Aquabacterium sp. A7-Y]
MNACNRFCRTVSVGAAALALASAWAADPTSEERYRAERAACESGWSHQDKATCLKEAGAARGEARRGRLESKGAAYERNALARCAPLPAADRADCEARVRGEGTVRGSVESGGIYKETVTREIPAAPPASGTTVTPAAPAATPQQ